MEFDYFYGPEDAEQYQFYRIPKLLITSERFKDVSVESKLLYAIGLVLLIGVCGAGGAFFYLKNKKNQAIHFTIHII